jgi:hypothetical protein
MISAEDSGSNLALVEHLLPTDVLAAPLYRHSWEDEYSYVLEGRVGAMLGVEEIYALQMNSYLNRVVSGIRFGMLVKIPV